MKKTVAWVVTVIIAIIVLAVLSSSFYIVAEDEYVNVLRFSKTISTTSEAGLHVKIPFIDTTKSFPKQVMIYDMLPSDVLTADGKSMQVDNYIIWRITDPLTYYKTLGTQAEAENRLDILSYNALKTIMGTLSRDEIINQDEESRDALNTKTTEVAAEAAVGYGIEVVDIKIKKLDLPEDNEQAVYRRMISERNKIAEEYRAEGNMEATKIKNEVDKTVNIMLSDANAKAEELRAEGEAEYMRILAEAYNTDEKRDFYYFIRALDALEASLDGGSKTIILGKDSELAKLLVSP